VRYETGSTGSAMGNGGSGAIGNGGAIGMVAGMLTAGGD